MRTLAIFSLGLLLGVGGALSIDEVQKHLGKNQPYAEQQGRSISSLSADDVAKLKVGDGWGLAKPAEFNGYPGPAHVLEFAEHLNLSEKQLSAVKASHRTMKQRAVQLGKDLIDAESALDAAFMNKEISPDRLRTLLVHTENSRSQLREVHLAAHLEVTPLLTNEQKLKYAELRGYGANGHSGHGSH